MTTVEAFAPAKINLTLHVTGRRADGYHLLDSLVAFSDIGDRITAQAADELSLELRGPHAEGVPKGDDNLVLRAARLLSPARGARIILEKNLPPASGIGGGSSDAAAALRALSALWGLPLPDVEQTATLGADVPVCLDPRARRMKGIGEILSDVPALPRLDILLVNPGVAVATPAVFAALERRDNPPMPHTLPGWPDAATFIGWLAEQRNDLAASATALAPEIGAALALVRDTKPLFASMSGSGATCFGLYPADGHSARAARVYARLQRPDWWSREGMLLG
jgi:4-diphosphocytidyl-2-C-methyl-D-erythritol kinase